MESGRFARKGCTSCRNFGYGGRPRRPACSRSYLIVCHGQRSQERVSGAAGFSRKRQHRVSGSQSTTFDGGKNGKRLLLAIRGRWRDILVSKVFIPDPEQCRLGSNQKSKPRDKIMNMNTEISRTRKIVARFTVMLAVLSSVVSDARADTIVSSLENTQVGPPIYSPIIFSPGSWAASSFQTDNQYWNLSSVTLMLGRGGFSPSTADLRLYSDAGGQPGVSLADLGPLTLSGGNELSLVTFTLASGLTLDPSTTYWIAVGNTSLNQGLQVGVLLDDVPPPFTFTGVPGASMICSATSSVGNGVNPPTTWVTPSPNGALLFAVDGSLVVPEPTTLSLMFLAGLVGWGGVSKRTAKKTCH